MIDFMFDVADRLLCLAYDVLWYGAFGYKLPYLVPGDPGGELIVPAHRFGMILTANVRKHMRGTEGRFDGAPYALKMWKHIGPKDKCQRGPDGKPLYRVTPFVCFSTYDEWVAIGERLNQ